MHTLISHRISKAKTVRYTRNFFLLALLSLVIYVVASSTSTQQQLHREYNLSARDDRAGVIFGAVIGGGLLALISIIGFCAWYCSMPIVLSGR
jgi:Na+/H+ antiporter NhaD/arsenite permease-like protein